VSSQALGYHVAWLTEAWAISEAQSLVRAYLWVLRVKAEIIKNGVKKYRNPATEGGQCQQDTFPGNLDWKYHTWI
jgi:hypothetical protein